MAEVKEVVKSNKATKQKSNKAKQTRTRKTKVEKADAVKNVDTELTVVDTSSVTTEQPQVIDNMTTMYTEYDVVPTETKTFILYTKKYYEGKINFDKVYEMGAEVGSLCVVKEWKVYFGKPSKYVPVALYMLKVGGWELIEPAQPVEG